ncbi:MAG: ATP-binding protein, partial [Burkholderiales bacterium]
GHIRVTLQLAMNVPVVASDRNRMRQVLINLVKNAVEAMPNGGELILGTRDNINVDGLPCVQISVADHGAGIAQDIQAHLFEPVRSTKGEGHAGLGLSIVRKLVKELRGFVRCSTESNRGTVFEVLIPRIPLD